MVNFILKGKPFPFTFFLGIFLNLNLLLPTHGQTKIQRIEFYFQQASTDMCDEGLEIDLISFQDEIPDLQDVLSVDAADIKQIRVVGAWIVYSEVNFEGKTNIFPNDGCYVIDHRIPTIRSARFYGNSNARLPGISLFPSQAWPTGNMIYYGESDLEIDLAENPVCVAFWGTSGSNGWTFFSGPGFTGLSKCRYGWGNNGFFQVYSIKQGCGFTQNSNDTHSLVDVKTPGESRLDVWASCRPAVIVPITTSEPATTTPETTTTTPTTTTTTTTTTPTTPPTTTPTTTTSTERTTENEIVQTSVRTTESSSEATGTTEEDERSTTEEDERSTTESSSPSQFQFSKIMSIFFVVIPILINFC